jgi:hypothetical protein
MRSSWFSIIAEWHVENIRATTGQLLRNFINKFWYARIVGYGISQLFDNRFCVPINNIHFNIMLYTFIEELLLN